MVRRPESIILESGIGNAMANLRSTEFIPFPLFVEQNSFRGFFSGKRNEFRATQARPEMAIVLDVRPATILEPKGQLVGWNGCSEQNKIAASSRTAHVVYDSSLILINNCP